MSMEPQSRKTTAHNPPSKIKEQMGTVTENMVRYWRHCIADAALGKGGLSNKEVQNAGYTELKQNEFNSGKLSNSPPFFSKTDSEQEKSVKNDNDFVKVLIRPFVYLKSTSHAHGTAVSSTLPSVLAPVSIVAWLGRDGRLFTGSRPVVARDVMDPLTQENGYVVTNIEAFDHFIDNNSFNGRDDMPSDNDGKSADIFTWHDSVDYTNKLAEILSISSDEYAKADYALISPCDMVVGASRKVINLYDLILRESPETPLLSRLAQRNVEPNAAPAKHIESNSTISIRLGHSDPKYPLAQAQRDAISHFMQLPDHETLAVNGPPGTGKTTLLQSLLACIMVSRALEKRDPPVVFACSTNNQAVTNIIDAFQKVPDKEGDPFGGRWIPDNPTLGVYYPSQQKKDEAIKNGYFIIDQLDAMEADEDYQVEAETYYLNRAAAAFGVQFDKIQAVVDALHNRLNNAAMRIKQAVESYEYGASVEAECRSFFNADFSWYQQITDLDVAAKTASKVETSWRSAIKDWDQHLLDEPWWTRLFAFIPAVRKKIEIRSKQTLERYEQILGDIEEFMTEYGNEDIAQILRTGYAESKKRTAQRLNKKERADDLLSRFQRSQAVIKQAVQACIPGVQDLELKDFDQRLDASLRHEMFRLAIHYYEGLWLLECATLKTDPDKKSVKKQARKARRQAKVAPCSVATFFMAPDLYRAWDVPNKKDLPAYNLADILIVDEGGQVSPEVACATFALASKAIVVGDTWQIEPVWSAEMAADGGNLIECGIVPNLLDADGWEDIHARGYTASAGSILKMAQNASLFHYEPSLERGMYLFEHRRCADSIIQYCNDLCYHGALIPRSGEPKDALYPTLGYMDIPGRSSNEQSSRVNTIEAETIAAWVHSEGARMREAYQMPIEDIVAVVTPFKAQSNAIKRALVARDSSLSKITVGTVHSLQGAEKLVIIFSPTYDPHSSGPFFFDRGVNMLNVAVSRAKHSFLVFGAISIFNAANSSTPSGMLAKHISKTGSFQIPLPEFDARITSILRRNCSETPTSLFTPEDHDKFLVHCLETAQKHVSIVSPWTSEYVVNQYAGSIASAIRRGVEIRVFYDSDKVAKQQQEKAIQRLKELNVYTKPMKHIHSKIINKDDQILATGSFNWLSALRLETHQLRKQIEHSIVFDSAKVGRDEVEFQLAAIRSVLGNWGKSGGHELVGLIHTPPERVSL